MSDSFRTGWNNNIQEMFCSENAEILDQFIQNELQPQEKYLQQIAKKIDNILKFLKENLSRPVNNIILGGSYGRDTVLKGQSDGTFVIFLQKESEMKPIKWNLIDLEPLATMGQVKIVEDKLQLVLTESELCITFDVIPIINTFVIPRNRDTSKCKPSPETYELWITSRTLNLESPVHFTELQGNFFNHCSRKLKNLILLVKYWYQQYQKRLNQDSFPLQYALELLTVYAWEQMHDYYICITTGFLIVLKLITNYNQLCIYWTVNYDFENQTIRNYLQSQLGKDRPIILDPADPTNNVGGNNPKLWKQLAKEAKTWILPFLDAPHLISSDVWVNVLPTQLIQIPSWDLDNFISKFLQPDKEFQDQVSRALDIIFSFLKENCFWNSSTKILKIVQGGSFATGTALKDQSDANIVVFLSHPFECISHVKVMREIFMQLRACQRKMQFDVKFELSLRPYQWSFTLMSKTLKHRMEFYVTATFDVLGKWVSKYQPDPEIFIKLIKSNIVYYNGELTELERDFYRPHPTKLKNLICLMKHWYRQCKAKCKGYLPEEDALVFLTVYAWEQGSGTEDFDTAEGFLTVLKLIMQFPELCIYWTVNYDFQNKIIRDFLMSQLKKNRPLILHPINPCRCVGEGMYKDWNILAQEAKIWLSSLCFKTRNFDPVKSWPVLPALLQQTPSWELDNFISKFLQPNKKFQGQVNGVVNMISLFLQQNCFQMSSIEVLKVVQGGPFATGTALMDKSDASLVVFLSCFHEFRDQGTNQEKISQQIRGHLENFQQMKKFDVKFEIAKWENSHNLSFTLMSQTLEHRVDFTVLPAFNALGNFPVDKIDPQIYINLIKSSECNNGSEFSICFTELRNNFMISRPTKLKNLIYLMKHWYQQCKRKLKKTDCLPPEYALELLTVYAWEQGSNEEDFNTATGFLTVLKLIMQYPQLCIYWTVNYNFFQNEIISNFLDTQLKKSRPVILDPADPTEDVGGGHRWCWHLLAHEAEIWSSFLCFKKRNFETIKTWSVKTSVQ